MNDMARQLAMGAHLELALAAIENMDRITTEWDASEPYTVDLTQEQKTWGTLLTMTLKSHPVELDRRIALASQDAMKHLLDAMAALENWQERLRSATEDDPLWCLGKLSEGFARRFYLEMLIRLGVVSAVDDSGKPVFYVQGPMVLEDGKKFFSLRRKGEYDNLTAKIRCSVAFADVPEFHGTAFDASGLLWAIAARVSDIAESG